jgi:hypothetical protein
LRQPVHLPTQDKVRVVQCLSAMLFIHVAEQAYCDEYSLDLPVKAGDAVNEVVASERWLDADAMPAHAVDFRWRCELAPIGAAGVSAEELPVIRVDVHDVLR